jgi:hypothetical protein
MLYITCKTKQKQSHCNVVHALIFPCFRGEKEKGGMIITSVIAIPCNPDAVKKKIRKLESPIKLQAHVLVACLTWWSSQPPR